MSIAFYIIGALISFFHFFLFSLLSNRDFSLSFQLRWTFVVIVWLILPFIGYLIGYRKEKGGYLTLENKHMTEIKQLLIERKSMNKLEEKIRNWKKEGYIVSELEEMIYKKEA